MKDSRRAFFKRAAITGAGVAAGSLAPQAASAAPVRVKWDREVDVVVVGAGAMGLPAALRAQQAGASVLLLEATRDIGGHAIVSSGNVALGGGTSVQKKFGIADSPDLLFKDLVDWSVIEPNGFPEYRYNDREIIRAFADNAAATFEWLVAQGVTFVDKGPDNAGGTSIGNSVLREMHCAPLDFVRPEAGVPFPESIQKTRSHGVGLMRPLEAAAKKANIPILLDHHMDSLIRENQTSGRVLGVVANNKGKMANFRARKAVILATGGSTGNVNFRRIFDPRLTEEYCGVAGEPHSFQDASGEIAAMAIGASLWGAYNQIGEFGINITKPGWVGCRYGYRALKWLPGSAYFQEAGASGLTVSDWQNLILVNQVGQRFYDETAEGFTSNRSGSVQPYEQGGYRNLLNVKMEARSTAFLDAAMAGTGEPVNGGGPIWAIFDADAVKRENWNTHPPDVDSVNGFFFEGNTLAELASKVVMKYQAKPLPTAALQDTVARYNSFVDAGRDADFDKPKPKYKIQTAPFYAAWATPVIHDTRAGLRINAKCQVVDLSGKVIQGLYAGGECAGGFSEHGLARCTCQGYIAGSSAAAEEV
jgi:succinate dehydrogenase/fumarate reductase flavoprotein subunit